MTSPSSMGQGRTTPTGSSMPDLSSQPKVFGELSTDLILSPMPPQMRQTMPNGWQRTMRAGEAWIQIAMSVQGQCLNTILDAKNMKECWDKLATKLEGKGEGRVAYLMEGLFRGALSESEPMEPQIETFLATGEGRVKVKLRSHAREHHIILQDVLIRKMTR